MRLYAHFFKNQFCFVQRTGGGAMQEFLYSWENMMKGKTLQGTNDVYTGFGLHLFQQAEIFKQFFFLQHKGWRRNFG